MRFAGQTRLSYRVAQSGRGGGRRSHQRSTARPRNCLLIVEESRIVQPFTQHQAWAVDPRDEIARHAKAAIAESAHYAVQAVSVSEDDTAVVVSGTAPS